MCGLKKEVCFEYGDTQSLYLGRTIIMVNLRYSHGTIQTIHTRLKIIFITLNKEVLK
jgi:hypothetical protein